MPQSLAHCLYKEGWKAPQMPRGTTCFHAHLLGSDPLWVAAAYDVFSMSYSTLPKSSSGPGMLFTRVVPAEPGSDRLCGDKLFWRVGVTSSGGPSEVECAVQRAEHRETRLHQR